VTAKTILLTTRKKTNLFRLLQRKFVMFELKGHSLLFPRLLFLFNKALTIHLCECMLPSSRFFFDFFIPLHHHLLPLVVSLTRTLDLGRATGSRQWHHFGT
jgi:hypothetical protein